MAGTIWKFIPVTCSTGHISHGLASESVCDKYGMSVTVHIGGPVTGEIVDDIRNMGIVFQDIPYSCIFQTVFQIFARAQSIK